MNPNTRSQYKAFLQQVALLNHLDARDVVTRFTVDPSVSQTLESKIQESSDFLKKINIVSIDEQSGQKIGLGVDRPIASTIDTDTKEREPLDPSSLDEVGYVCTQTNFDTALKYAKLDAWAKFPDF